ncbi:hypothetical protein K470DRAFT_255001 [Piedraia hortae CBS 480.64]|uniref:Uncharacterized protein n=1 Tax=Piedraia hortae CBS 480.64 TaxID=1314780 RepID=A0A6A7C7U2_9PEZI|nr:hypothetical protein K470DRAFT_255001 [Piedraia hortae CBS 480.64]
MPQTKPSPTANVRPHRLPAPTLFVGPPSRTPSHISLSQYATDPRSSLEEGKQGDDSSPATQKDVKAQWRNMRSTLNEVELTVQSSTHVFGQQHTAALDKLREAQIEIARAWGKDGKEKEKEQTERKGSVASTVLSNPSLADELESSERDVRRATQRRKENREFFRNVQESVRDVVEKLDQVAVAMKGVEDESRWLWSGQEKS